MSEAAYSAAASHAALIATQLAVSRCGRDLEAAFRCVVEGAAAVVRCCELAAIEVVEGDELVYRASSAPASIGVRLPLTGSASGLCLGLGRAMLIDDAGTDARVNEAACRALGIGSMVLVPIPRHGVGAGVLKLACSRTRAFVEQDVLLGQLLVGILAAGLSAVDETEAREALASSEAFNRRILQSSGDRIELLDLEGRIVSINQAGLALLGLRTDAGIIGTDWLEGWPTERRLEAAAALAEAQAGQCGHFRAAGLASGSRRRWWDVAVTPIPGADGAPHRLLSMSRDITELHDASERIELALDAGSVLGIGVWDSGVLSIDSRMAGMLGLAAGAGWRDIAPSALLDQVHPGDQATLRALPAQAAQDSGRFRAAFRLRADPAVQVEGWRWLEARGLAASARNGEVARVTGVLIDIDARKRAELELELNEQTLRQIADSVPILIAYVGPDLACRFVNRAYAGWFGRPLQGGPGRPMKRLLGVALDDGPRVLLERALAGETIRFDGQVRHRDGTLRDVDIGYQPRRRGGGEIDGCYVIGIDITRRQEEARALNRSNLTLEHSLAMVQHESEQVWRLARDLLSVFDADGALRSFNPAWSAALGWEPEQLRGRRYSDFLHPDDVDRTARALGLIAGSGGRGGFENRWRCRDGSYRWLSWNAVLADGLLYAAGRDVTAEKDAALRLARTEEQLRQSQKMEAVGQLTGGIAHDFNNLLTGVIGSIEMMRHRLRQGRAGELDRYLDAAAGAAERAASLTHRLLAFSRRQTLDPKRIAAQRLVDGMEDLIRRTAGPAVTLQIVRHPGLWSIFCDPGQLEAALVNLANNAREAMPDGGRLVIETGNAVLDDADTEGEIPPGDYVAISVADTGAGMSAEVAARAFDPFFTTKPIGHGTGLGLSMIYGFTRQSGGDARIATVPGRGARVTIYLPRYRDPRGEPPGGGKAAPAHPGHTVLLVEDEPMVRMLLGEALGEIGCDTIEASDGVGGLRVMQDDKPVDLLITDIGLPGGINGRQLAEAARTLRPELRVLFITGAGQSAARGAPAFGESLVRGEGPGDLWTQVIEKPFTMELLMQRVRSMIRMSPARAPLQPPVDAPVQTPKS